MKRFADALAKHRSAKKLRLYLHIGQPKTATTTIQSYLAKNSATLVKHGWLYPNAARQYFAHHLLGNFFIEKPQFWIEQADPQRCHDELMAEVERSGCKNVVMSTESLFFIPSPERVRDYFKEFDVIPIVSLRRQDEWIESAYREELKNGRISCGPEAYIRQRFRVLDYEFRINLWERVFSESKIIVIPFEKVAGSLYFQEVFLNAVGISDVAGMKHVESQNDSLCRDCLEFYSNFKEAPRINPYHERIKIALARYSKLNPDPIEYRYFFSPKCRLEIIDRYAEQNARLGRRFLGESADSLFSSASPNLNEVWAEYPGLTVENSVRISEFLMKSLHGAVAQRKSIGAADAQNLRSRRLESDNQPDEGKNG